MIALSDEREHQPQSEELPTLEQVLIAGKDGEAQPATWSARS